MLINWKPLLNDSFNNDKNKKIQKLEGSKNNDKFII